MNKNYMNYDSTRGTIAQYRLNTYKINAYKDSTSSVVINTHKRLSPFETKILKMKRLKFINPITIGSALLFGSAIFTLLNVMYHISNMSITLLIFCSSFLTMIIGMVVSLKILGFDDSLIHLEGVGDHLTDDDVEKIIDLCHNSEGDYSIFIEDVRNHLVLKDPTGVKSELVDQYNESMKSELEKAEMKKEEIVHKLNNLDLNQPSLSTRLKIDANKLESEAWEKSLSEISS